MFRFKTNLDCRKSFSLTNVYHFLQKNINKNLKLNLDIPLDKFTIANECCQLVTNMLYISLSTIEQSFHRAFFTRKHPMILRP